MTGKPGTWVLRIFVATCTLVCIGALVLLAVAMRHVGMPGTSFGGGAVQPTSLAEELARSLRRDVEFLATTIGPRDTITSHAALVATAEWIEEELRKAGLEPTRETYQSRGKEVWNIIVEFRPKTSAVPMLVVGAHYDTVPGSPGADDNSSGVAGLLAMARHYAEAPPAMPVRCVFFTNEESPYAHTPEMGSYVNASRSKERGEELLGMICLEMIGFFSDAKIQQYPLDALKNIYPEEANFIAFATNERSGDFLRRCLAEFRAVALIPSEGLAAPDAIRDVTRSDHWSYIRHGYDAFMVTDTSNFRYVHYHKAEDTPDKLDYHRMALVVMGVIGMVEGLARTG
jgi:hypothetical protein